MRTALSLLTGLLLTGCATMSNPSTSTPSTSGSAQKALTQPSAAEEALLQTDRDFNTATQAKGAEGWASFFDEHGTMLPPGTLITGREGIRNAMAPLGTALTLTWEPQRAEITPGGKLGYTTGRFHSVRKAPDGQTIERTGTYISLWRKQADGSWKAIADVGDPDAPPAAPATPPPAKTGNP